MKTGSIFRHVFVSGFLLMLMFLLTSGGRSERAGAAAEADAETEAEADAFAGRSVSSREEALELLRDIGMSVFTDEMVEAPDFTTQNLSGEEVSLSDYAGKVIFLNFWATWCGPCKAEMPTMNDLYADLKNEDFVVLAVNQQEDPELVQDFIDGTDFTFPIILDNDGIINVQYGIRGIPTTFIIGTDGNVLAGKVGTHNYDGELYRSLFRNLM